MPNCSNQQMYAPSYICQDQRRKPLVNIHNRRLRWYVQCVRHRRPERRSEFSQSNNGSLVVMLALLCGAEVSPVGIPDSIAAYIIVNDLRSLASWHLCQVFPRRALGVSAPHLQTCCLISHFEVTRPIMKRDRTSARRVAAVCRSWRRSLRELAQNHVSH